MPPVTIKDTAATTELYHCFDSLIARSIHSLLLRREAPGVSSVNSSQSRFASKACVELL